MQVKSIAECSKRAFCNTFDLIKLTSVLKNFVFPIFEWTLKTGLTVYGSQGPSNSSFGQWISRLI